MSPEFKQQFAWNNFKSRLVFWGGAVAVGAACAGFAFAADWVIGLQARIAQVSSLLMLLLAPPGFMAVVWLTRNLFVGTEGSGIPQAIAAVKLPRDQPHGHLVSLKIAFGKIFLTLAGLLAGASIGREGPSVHVGASIMHSIGRLARFPHHYLERSLVLAGGAAGIAAAFNTPIAGLVFAIEEMARSFEERTTGTLLTAVIIAGVVATALLGNYSYFGHTNSYLPDAGSWVAVPLCGLIGGALGGLFSHLLLRGQARIRPFREAHPYRTAALLGLAVAVLGILSSGHSFGTGYGYAHQLLDDDPDISPLFPFFKLAATALSYLSGIPGGLFSPSLSIGAGIGVDLAPLAGNAPLAAMAILGMAGYLTGALQTPLTASVIVMEMANAHEMILPILATAFLSMGTSRLICRQSLYQAMADQFLPRKAPEPPAAAPVPPANPPPP